MPDPLLSDGQRLFKRCAYCHLIRLCSFYGRRWLCADCAEENL